MNDDPIDENNDFDFHDNEPVKEALVIDVDGFEGPLDLLLMLARSQKVDLSKISILKLARQYLAFIEKVRSMRLELAADYLVMAAWLAFLKSKLLLPELEEKEEESGEELAQILAHRLKRLEAMRDAANRLMERNQLGKDVFARGDPEAVKIIKINSYDIKLYDLLKAYANQRQRQSVSFVEVKKRKVWSLQEARQALSRLLGLSKEWVSLDDYLLDYLVDDDQKTTMRASSFTASLELVKEGVLEVRQYESFAPLYFRKIKET